MHEIMQIIPVKIILFRCHKIKRKKSVVNKVVAGKSGAPWSQEAFNSDDNPTS